jgi:hypothetical protein
MNEQAPERLRHGKCLPPESALDRGQRAVSALIR